MGGSLCLCKNRGAKLHSVTYLAADCGKHWHLALIIRNIVEAIVSMDNPLSYINETDDWEIDETNDIACNAINPPYW